MVRLVLVIGLLLVAAGVLAPIQRLARRFGWSLARYLPVLFCRALCWLVNVRPQFHGTPARGPHMLVPNHVSWLDIPALGCFAPVAFVAKQEVAAWPIMGGLAKLQGAIFIDRSRRRHLPASNRRMAERILTGDSLILFPEGTTGDGNRLSTFRTSHFEAAKDALRLDPTLRDVRVQPVSIAYTRINGIPLGRSARHRIAWYGDMTLMPHLWGMVTGGPIDCDITFGEAIAVDLCSDRKQVGRQAERAVRITTARMLTGRDLVPIVPLPQTPARQAVLIGAERS